MNNLFNTIGLAARARCVATGETLIKRIPSGDVKFVIIATDASENSKKKITDKCKFYHIDYIIDYTSDELSNAIGKNNRMAIGITEKGFAKNIKEKIGG